MPGAREGKDVSGNSESPEMAGMQSLDALGCICLVYSVKASEQERVVLWSDLKSSHVAVSCTYSTCMCTKSDLLLFNWRPQSTVPSCKQPWHKWPITLLASAALTSVSHSFAKIFRRSFPQTPDTFTDIPFTTGCSVNIHLTYSVTLLSGSSFALCNVYTWFIFFSSSWNTTKHLIRL